MATVTIIHKTDRAIIGFKRSFYLMESYPTRDIIWRADDDDQNPGIITAWVQYADTNPQIVGISPKWHIAINGVTLEQKLYEEIDNLKGKEIYLSQGDWTFMFNFKGK